MTDASRRMTAQRTLARRAAVVWSLATTPGDAMLVLKMLGWRLVLPALKRRLPLQRLVRLMWDGHGAPAGTPVRAARIAYLADLVYRTEHVERHGNCLERSLVLYRYLGAAGAEPQLLVGLRRDGQSAPGGHAWVTLAGEPVGEPPDSIAPFARVVAFGTGGSVSRAEGRPGETQAAL